MIGLITLFADLRFPDEIADFFGNDVLQCYEDYFAGLYHSFQIDMKTIFIEFFPCFNRSPRQDRGQQWNICGSNKQ